MQKPQLWSKDFVIITLTNFLLYSIYYLLMVTIAAYAMDQYGASPSTAGLVSSIFVVGIMIARLYCGKAIYKVGQKRMLFVGFLLYLITTLAYFLVYNLASLLLVRLVNGIAMGVASTATATIVAGIVPSSRRGEGIGYYSLGITLALAAGPFLGLLMMQTWGFNANLGLSIALLLLSFVAVSFVQPAALSTAEDQTSHTSKTSTFSIIQHLLEPKVIPIASFTMVIGLCYSGVLAFLAPYLKEIGLVSAGGYFFLVYAILVFASRPFIGKRFDEKGENAVIYPTTFCFLVGMLLLSQAQNGTMLLLAGGLIGVGYSSICAITQTISIKIVPPSHIALATSTMFIFLDIGVGLGPYLLGFLVSSFGYRGMYSIMAGVILLSFYRYHRLYGKHTKP